MKFDVAIDDYVQDMRLAGRMNSPSTERDYRGTLYQHLDDVGNRDPRKVGREDVKRTLARWPHPNSRRKNRSVLISFYDWMVEEGLRETNPARQTRRPKRKASVIYRLSRDEVVALMGAAHSVIERRAIYFGVCAGLRNAELRGIRGRHLRRAGAIWVSEDIAKGGRERWIPVIDELAPVVFDAQRTLEDDDYLLPAQRWRDPGTNRAKLEKRKLAMSANALRYLVQRVGKRAGINAPLHPHMMRHACADHIARQVDVRTAQMLLGHAGIATTETYLGKPTLDELKSAVSGFSFGSLLERSGLSRENLPANPVEAPTGIEPVYAALQAAA